MESSINNKSLEKFIAMAYILLLPIRMFLPLAEVTVFFRAAANYFDFLLHLLGMGLLIIRKRGKIRSTKLVNSFAKTILFLLVSSIFMSLILYNSLGSLDGETTLDAIIGPTIYYVQYIFIMIYNVNIFRIFTMYEIEKLLYKTIKWLLVLGYIQVLICIGIGGIASFYDSINVLGAFQSGEYIQELGRIPLAGSEPAAGGWMIGLFVFPYLLSKIVTNACKKEYFWQILAWLPIIYFTKSTTCYILVACDFLVFTILFFRNTSGGRMKNFLLISMFVVVLIVLLIVVGDLTNNPAIERIRYLLFEKVTDVENQSTVTRTIPTYINFRIFLRYPIFGVGNGNQGFFYREYFPEWGEISSYTFERIYGVADGGVFIPSLFSGFGIVGVIIFIYYAVRHVKLAMQEKKNLGSLYYMFMIAAVAFVVNGFQGDYFGQYLPIFIMCIPFMSRCCKHTPESKS